MAVTKIHPIKKTLYSAINYIVCKEKTDEQKLVYSKNCIDKFAHIQFENTRKVHKVKGTILAHHLIQSFLPDEVDIDTANKIGKDLCDKILDNDYEYVLATHIDKGHIHNHIIFNNVSYTTGRCYQSNKKSYYKIRNESDKLCMDNNLIVIDKYYSEYVKKFKRSKTNTNYYDTKKINTFKSKLKYSIDKAILQANSYDQFLKIMSDKGYEIKFGKHIAFKHATQNKFTRSKSINENYTEESIRNRIEDSSKHLKQYAYNSLIDIEHNVKVKNNNAYKFLAKKHNLKTMAAKVAYFKLNKADNNELSNVTNRIICIYNEIRDLDKHINILIKIIEKMYVRDSTNNITNSTKYLNSIHFLNLNNSNHLSYKEATEKISSHKKSKHLLFKQLYMIRKKLDYRKQVNNEKIKSNKKQL